MNELVIKNCKFVDNSEGYYIGINNGKISEISKQPLKADEEINANGNFVLPGLIDPHVHFRDPGLTYKESFKTGSLAAAHGGFTTVLDMPNTVPPTNTYSTFKEKKKIAESKSIIDFGLHSGLNTLNEIKKIAKLNPASFKIFMDLFSDEELEEMFKNVSLLNKEKSNKNNRPKYILSLHCENKSIIEENTKRLKKLACTRGNTAIDYSYARPSEAEVNSIKYAVSLAEKYNTPLHICHLSTNEGLKYIQSIPSSQADITTEATPHHLLLDNSSYNKYGTMMKTNPPLRPNGENITTDYLSSMNMIGTDHAPHSIEEKQKGVWDSSPGIPSIETVFPLMLTEVNKGKISLEMVAKLMSENPAKRFNMNNKGKIELGYDADLVIVDLKKEGMFNIDTFYTKAEYSPFENWEYKGIATMTISHGNVVMEEDYIATANLNQGKYIYD